MANCGPAGGGAARRAAPAGLLWRPSSTQASRVWAGLGLLHPHLLPRLTPGPWAGTRASLRTGLDQELVTAWPCSPLNPCWPLPCGSPTPTSSLSPPLTPWAAGLSCLASVLPRRDWSSLSDAQAPCCVLLLCVWPGSCSPLPALRRGLERGRLRTPWDGRAGSGDTGEVSEGHAADAVFTSPCPVAQQASHLPKWRLDPGPQGSGSDPGPHARRLVLSLLCWDLQSVRDDCVLHTQGPHGLLSSSLPSGF